MEVPPRTPVLVGIGTATQREDDPDRAAPPDSLMAEALRRAAADAGTPSLLEKADSVRVSRGFWNYPDPARLVGDAVGATAAHTEVFEIGVLQTSLFGSAARDIAAGRAEIVLVAGGEAKHRAQRLKAAGRPEGLSRQAEGTAPGRVHRPHGEILSKIEIENGLAMPVGAYAMADNALRAAEGQSLDAHRDDLAALWSAMSRVASKNPDAWSPEFKTPETIRDPGPRNRMLCFPYTRLHNSQWNVDQAAGLIFTSADRARQLGIPRDRWVFPLAVAEANAMLPLTNRKELHRSAGFRLAGEKALAQVGATATDLDHVELYSCFPAAVRIQQRELGLDPGAPTTVTGGMSFAGGPLNNFVLQATAKMAAVLRDDPASLGMVNAVSGLMTKQGVSLWSTEPRGEGFPYDDVSDETEACVGRVEVVDDRPERARIVSYTVAFEAEAPSTAILLCERDDGRRVLVALRDQDLALELTRSEGCGREVAFRGDDRAILA